MRKGLLALATLFFTVVQGIAQTSPIAQSITLESPIETECPISVMQFSRELSDSRVWGSVDYLLWWVKGTPLPPLVTVGDPNVGFPLTNTAGSLGQPSTQILYGGSPANFDATSGIRLNVGGWLDTGCTFGIEGSTFFLQNSTSFKIASDAAGNPALYIPAINANLGEERALLISDPLRGFNGSVVSISDLQLWGLEANCLLNVLQLNRLSVLVLAGLRYVDLEERLTFANTTSDLLFPSTTTFIDQFNTRNQFYGGQIGSRVSWGDGRFSIDVSGKVAIGSTYQSVDVHGAITQSGAAAITPGTFRGGFFTQATNLGQATSNTLSVIPSVDLKVGYQFTKRLRGTVGYDFIWWSNVVRPGDQIDRNINLSQSPVFTPLGGGTLAGPLAPAPQFNNSSFWAHGVSFGLEYRY